MLRNCTHRRLQRLNKMTKYRAKITNRCCARTKQGLRCKKKNDGPICSVHTTCSICLDDCKSRVKLHCGHSFCKDCIYTWLGGIMYTCPNCRKECTDRELIDSQDYGVLNGSLIMITNYIHYFTSDDPGNIPFYEYLEDILYFHTWMSERDFENIIDYIYTDDVMSEFYS